MSTPLALPPKKHLAANKTSGRYIWCVGGGDGKRKKIKKTPKGKKGAFARKMQCAYAGYNDARRSRAQTSAYLIAKSPPRKRT